MYENIFTVFLQFLQYHAPQKAVMLQRLGSPSQNHASIFISLLQLDIPFSQVFFKWLLGEEHSLTSSDLQYVDPIIAKSFNQLEDVQRQKHRILADKSHVSYSLIHIHKMNC